MSSGVSVKLNSTYLVLLRLLSRELNGLGLGSVSSSLLGGFFVSPRTNATPAVIMSASVRHFASCFAKKVVRFRSSGFEVSRSPSHPRVRVVVFFRSVDVFSVGRSVGLFRFVHEAEGLISGWRENIFRVWKKSPSQVSLSPPSSLPGRSTFFSSCR